MAMIEAEVLIDVHVLVVFAPFATYQRFRDVAITKVLGVPVYKRVGDQRSLFGVCWSVA